VEDRQKKVLPLSPEKQLKARKMANNLQKQMFRDMERKEIFKQAM